MADEILQLQAQIMQKEEAFGVLKDKKVDKSVLDAHISDFKALNRKLEDKLKELGFKDTDDTGKPLSKAAKQKKTKEFVDKLVKDSKKDKEEVEDGPTDKTELIIIKEDPSLPKAIKCKIRDVYKYAGQRVKVGGWCHRLRIQKNLIFVTLRDGTGFLQCVLSGDLTKTAEAKGLNREATIFVYGILKEEPRAKDVNETILKANLLPFEIQADYWELVGASTAEIEGKLNEESDPSTMYDNRHILARGTKNSTILKLRSAVLNTFRSFLLEEGYIEITPPTIVQTQVEGGATLFKLMYYGEEAYMTQSSQLYLETTIPFLGDSFCIMPSYRAENHHTRRHLSEYTHLEAELPFITFEDLLNSIEKMVVTVIRRILEGPLGDQVRALNPSIKVPKFPFRRMDYSDAVQYCRDHNIYKDKENKIHFELGDDIPEAPERQMTDEINEPIFLCRFPAGMKAFYMSRDANKPDLTESVDLLLPNCGEILGGSMRIWKREELLAAFKREGISPEPYYWYTDQRAFGTTPHGGYGLGIERFLMYLLNLDHIRAACLYPRNRDRCKP